MGLFKTIEEAEEIVSKLFEAVQTVEKGLKTVTDDFSGFKEEVNKGFEDGRAAVKDLKGTFQKEKLTKGEPAATPSEPDAVDALANSKKPVQK